MNYMRSAAPILGEVQGDAALSEEVRRNALMDSSLDGEANLKLRTVAGLPGAPAVTCDAAAVAYAGVVRCEPPHPAFDRFVGTLTPGPTQAAPGPPPSPPSPRPPHPPPPPASEASPLRRGRSPAVNRTGRRR